MSVRCAHDVDPRACASCRKMDDAPPRSRPSLAVGADGPVPEMAARYASRCPRCDGWIREDDSIYKIDDAWGCCY